MTVNDIIRGCHQLKGTSGKKLTDDRHQDTADQSQGDGGMNSFGHFLVSSGSIKACCQNIGPKGNTDKQIGKYGNQCGCGTHSGQ